MDRAIHLPALHANVRLPSRSVLAVLSERRRVFLIAVVLSAISIYRDLVASGFPVALGGGPLADKRHCSRCLFYLSALVARLVGLHLMHARNSRSRRNLTLSILSRQYPRLAYVR